MKTESLPFIRNIPHLYPPDKITRRESETLEREGQHEGGRIGLPTASSTTLFTSLEKAVMATPSLLAAVESGKLTLPEEEVSFDVLSLVGEFAGAQTFHAKNRIIPHILQCVYGESREGISERLENIRKLLELQLHNADDTNTSYQPLEKALAAEFDPPAHVSGRIIFGPHTLREFREHPDIHFKNMIQDMSQTFAHGKRNILFIEQSPPVAPLKTFRKTMQDASRLYPSYTDSMFATIGKITTGRLPSQIDIDKEKKRFYEEASYSDMHMLMQLHAADVLQELGFEIEIIMENSPVSSWVYSKEVAKVHTLEQYERFLQRFAQNIYERDMNMAALLRDVVAESDKSTALYWFIGTFHHINMPRFLPYGLSQSVTIEKQKEPFYMNAPTTAILTQLLYGKKPTRDMYEEGYGEFVRRGE